MKPLQIEGARALADAGAINHVKIVASAGGLYVEINRTFTVANRTKQTRYFAKADTCFSWLREMGIRHVDEVDLAQWDSDGKPEIPGLAEGILAVWKFGVASVTSSEWAKLTSKVESLSKKGRHAEALLAATQALQLAEESLEPDHPDLAVLLNSLAVEHSALKQFDLAEPLYARALAIAEKAFGPDDYFVGTCLNNLAEACTALGKSDGTEAMYLRALTIFELEDHYHSGDISDQAIVFTNLASLYFNQGSYEQAEQLYEKALECWEADSGMLFPKPPNVALTLEGLAALYRKTGRDDKAAKLEKRAAKILGRLK